MPVAGASQASADDEIGQLGVPVSWVAAPVSAGTDDPRGSFYMVQRTRDDRLVLTPNEAFFPKLGLTATGNGTTQDVHRLNGDNSFASIEKWDSGDVAEWGLVFEQPGPITARLWMSAVDEKAKFTWQLHSDGAPDPMPSPWVIETSDDESGIVATAEFTIVEPGKQVLRLTCEEAGAKPVFHRIEISGPAAIGGAVLRKRWRPAAAHTKFSSSRDPDNLRLWVMEMDAVPGDLGFYCPITTPFGYYGPTWKPDGTVNSGFNFSLWSYGRGQPEPPVERLSHLLAIGDRQAIFGGFDHEGTGVKIRDWEPLAGRQNQRQTLALRVEPGEVHDTYFSYFYAADEKRWRLFGIGNKYNKQKPLDSLWVGSFVEVPGPPPVQRTGAYERTMRYRGWVMDNQSEWYPLDQMTNGNIDSDTGLTHTNRGITDEGWFFLQTGGWTFRKPPEGKFIASDDAARFPRPDYLTENDVEFLKTVPSEITVSTADWLPNRIEGTFHIRHLAQPATVTVYWGTNEGLTFANRWEHQFTIAAPQEGENPFSIDNVPRDKAIDVRMLLKNSEGQFWTRQTVQQSIKRTN